MKISWEKLLSIPKSFYLSLCYFPLREAVKLPVMVRYNTLILRHEGLIKVNSGGGVKTALLRVGFGNVGIFDKKYERSIWEVSGRIELNGKASFGSGSRLSVGGKGVLTIGDNFRNTARMNVVCQKGITIGDDVLVSWNTMVMDTDWHPSQDIRTGKISEISKEVVIGNRVWLCMNVSVLKGTFIPDGCIVGANALCVGSYPEPDALIAGNPAKVKRSHITLFRG